jgi:hypothetical protein
MRRFTRAGMSPDWTQKWPDTAAASRDSVRSEWRQGLRPGSENTETLAVGPEEEL